MKIYCSALTFLWILGSGISTEEATYNVPDRESITGSNLDSDLVDVLIKTSGKSESLSAMSFVLKTSNVVSERAGIIAAKVTKKDMEELKSDPNVGNLEVDQMAYVLDDTAGHDRKLYNVLADVMNEDTPYGIPMVLEDMDFWKELGTPSGSIKVCVADTGYDLGHEDLPSGSDVDGTDSPSNGAWDSDGHGHGSHCSGTVAGLGDNNKGVVGVIPDNMGDKFQLLIGKALNSAGSGDWASVLEAIEHCIDQGAKVISLSLGGGGYSSIHDEFYENHYNNNDILFVAAAGNGGNSAFGYPASYKSLMSVAAIDSNKNKASFSQYNDQVEISAPGVLVKSSLPDDKYASYSGTSMATPHVAGVAGLLWMYFPECKNYQIRNVLLATAEDLGDNGCDTKYGFGLVQAKKAYELLSQSNCTGNLAFGALNQDAPVGGCDQYDPNSSISPSTQNPAPVSPTTPYPTHIAPTPYPTHVAPTMYPTAAVPTPYPTDIPPTTCGVKGDPCTKHSQCCGGKCNLKKNFCRK